MNYYNEFDPKTAAWLRELIKRGAIPDGDVDERSIADVQPSDLRDYTQCHFFAGIGGWSLALQLAGWPAERPVWTGSCPCQPFSTAGKGLAQKDERHLWPVFFDLICQCRPEHVFGEQVANAIGHGWLDGVSADLEAEGYACGATVLGAHSVNSPHQRQRLYWVAYSDSGRLRSGDASLGSVSKPNSYSAGNDTQLIHCRDSGGSMRGLPITGSERWERWEGADKGSLLDGTDARREQGNGSSANLCEIGAWSDYRLAPCRDGKARRVPTEPAFFPLAHGVPARVVRLRGYGNAIVPECAKIFIEAFLDIQK